MKKAYLNFISNIDSKLKNNESFHVGFSVQKEKEEQSNFTIPDNVFYREN